MTRSINLVIGWQSYSFFGKEDILGLILNKMDFFTITFGHVKKK